MLKTGILGGGQLGKMLLQAAANYPVETYVLENDALCPAAHLCHHFQTGDINDYETVYQFGKNLDALTIEIENVNVEALERLEKEGKKIYPRPAVLRLIKSKILQKKFYRQYKIPTADFAITGSMEDICRNEDFLPAVHKADVGGYDGRGVQIIRNIDDAGKGFSEPAVLEKMIEIKKEIAVVVAITEQGEAAVYPPVEMHFDPVLNLLDYQICPSSLDAGIQQKAETIALSAARYFSSPGLFAIEMFVDINGNILVNETAPRVHNSGHHTIEAHFSSQFDMLWRIILGYPAGNTKAILPSVMVNIIGAEGYSGDVQYEGLDEVLKIKQAFVHIYGKKQSRPGRKMGHVTILGHDSKELLQLQEKVKQTLTAKSASHLSA